MRNSQFLLFTRKIRYQLTKNVDLSTNYELDSEEKIVNKNPFDFDESGNCLKCNETGYKIFTPKINNETII